MGTQTTANYRWVYPNPYEESDTWAQILNALFVAVDAELFAVSNSKANVAHTHTIANITGLQAALDGKQPAGTYAPLDSPGFSGVPLAPLAAKDTNNSQLATTSYVDRANRNLTINAQTSAAYTPVATDAGKVVMLTNAAANTCTINVDVFAAGDRVDFIQGGAGQTSFVAGTGFTLNSAAGALKLTEQWAGATVYFVSPSVGILIGNLVK